MNLQAFKFDTRILENGIIKIPDLENFVNKDIEVVVLLKPTQPARKKITAEEFITKWAGFINSDNPEDLKYEYLAEKYK